MAQPVGPRRAGSQTTRKGPARVYRKPVFGVVVFLVVFALLGAALVAYMWGDWFG